MKIRYKNKRLNFNLIFGTIWLAFSLFKLYTKENHDWTDFGFLVLSILYIATYFYEKKYQYLTIENEMIYKNWPFSKKINLAEIVTIRKFAGDYTIMTENKELKINTQLIDKDSLVELTLILDKLNTELSKKTVC